MPEEAEHENIPNRKGKKRKDKGLEIPCMLSTSQDQQS